MCTGTGGTPHPAPSCPYKIPSPAQTSQIRGLTCCCELRTCEDSNDSNPAPRQQEQTLSQSAESKTFQATQTAKAKSRQLCSTLQQASLRNICWLLTSELAMHCSQITSKSHMTASYFVFACMVASCSEEALLQLVLSRKSRMASIHATYRPRACPMPRATRMPKPTTERNAYLYDSATGIASVWRVTQQPS